MTCVRYIKPGCLITWKKQNKLFLANSPFFIKTKSLQNQNHIILGRISHCVLMWRLIWGRRWGCIDARLHCIDSAVNASIFGHHVQQGFYCCSRPPFFWDWSQICCTDNGNHNKGKACQANKNHGVNLCLY